MRECLRIARRMAERGPDGARVGMSWHLLCVEEALSEPHAADGGPAHTDRDTARPQPQRDTERG